jgi:hypothetical protein
MSQQEVREDFMQKEGGTWDLSEEEELCEDRNR